jgi:TetR/AcrR family transcriptional regulator
MVATYRSHAGAIPKSKPARRPAMPLKTFLNLTEERKARIIDACLEEFILRDYREASLTRIIGKLGLAKGSFYRYFASKKDLYAYLIEYCKRNTEHIFRRIFSESMQDVLEGWVRFYLACADQDNAQPLLGWFGYKVALDKNNVILGDVPMRSKMQGMKILKKIFLDQQKKGKIRRDLDVEMMIYALLQIQEGFLDYLAIKNGIEFADNFKKGKPLFPLPKEILRKELEEFAEILRYGLTPWKSKS